MMSNEKDASMVESGGDAPPSTADDNSGIPDENISTNQPSDTIAVPPSNNDSMATDQNDTTNINAHQTAEVSSSDGQNVEGKEPLAPVDNDSNTAMDQNEDTNEAGEVDDEEDDEDDGEEVKTYSGYLPISQISWDWEPPTSLDNQKKASPPKSESPPDTSQDQGYAGNSDGDFDRKPVEGLVYTEAGEKAKPTPYIWEIKARKFEKKPKNKLFVGGLTFEATKDFLYDQFEKYGEVDDACIVTEKGTGKSRGFGYVTFVNQDDAEEAIKAIDGLRINGKTLCVEFADDPKSSPRGPPKSSPRGPPKSSPRGPPGRGYRGGERPPQGRGYHSGRGQHYDMDRYSDRDPYYDRGPDPYYKRGGDDTYYDHPPPRDYDHPPPRAYDRPPPRDYDCPPPRDYYDRAPPHNTAYDRPPPRQYDRPPIRDYDRPPPPRDYYDRPHARDPAYDRPPPRDYDDYRKPPASYDDRYPPPAAPRRPSMTDVDVARLRVDREKVRRDRITSVEQQRLLTRQRKKQTASSPSSSSDSSDSEAQKPKGKKRHRVIPKAYMM